MNRRASRLHTLERSVKKPRGPRVKARALTVMRLEGASSAAPRRAHTRSARLPKDLEEQIAVVRGRAVGRPSRGLLQLEERLLGTHGGEPPAPVTHRYDHLPGPALPAPSPAPARSAPRAQALTLPEPFPGSAFGGRFTVESFEEPPSAQAPAAVSAARALSAGGGVPAAPPRVNVAPAAAQRIGGKGTRALSQDQQAIAADFERDLAAMLGSGTTPRTAPEDKQWEDTLRSTGGAPGMPSAPAAQTEAPPPPARSAHAVFDQMGLAMNYANSFDLGAVDLSARFDQFDKELAVAPKPAPAAATPVPVQALALDDFDLVADLAEISGAQSAAATNTEAPTPAAPTGQPTPNSEQAAAPAA